LRPKGTTFAPRRRRPVRPAMTASPSSGSSTGANGMSESQTPSKPLASNASAKARNVRALQRGAARSDGKTNLHSAGTRTKSGRRPARPQSASCLDRVPASSSWPAIQNASNRPRSSSAREPPKRSTSPMGSRCSGSSTTCPHDPPRVGHGSGAALRAHARDGRRRSPARDQRPRGAGTRGSPQRGPKDEGRGH
jgi:hypothetical protein